MTSEGGVTLNAEACLTFDTNDFNAYVGRTELGFTHVNSARCSSILGGTNNSICSSVNITNYANIGGGYYNCIISSVASNYFNNIGGGAQNQINAQSNNVIGGGSGNLIVNSSTYSAAIVGGNSNQINNSCYSFIGAGQSNCILNSRGSGILVGFNNNISSKLFSFVVGDSISATTNYTTYMNNATVACHLQVGGTTTMNSTTGRIDATNDVIAFATSDRRLKENIIPIPNSLCKVGEISGNTFDWKPLTKEEVQTIHGNTGKDVGVIAQEIEAVLPEAVTTRDSGYKAVNYEKIVPLLIEAIKDLTHKVEELELKISRNP